MGNYLASLAVAALYAGAVSMLLGKLREPDPAALDTLDKWRPTLWLAGFAVLLHGVITYQRSGLPDTLSMPFFTAFSITMIAIVFVQLLMCISRPADYLGMIIYPIAGIALLSSEIFPSQAKALPQSLQLHILLSVMAYAVLALCAAQAALVALQRHNLNHHRPGGFMRALPPLTSTESLLFTLLAIGFGLLTLSLASGFVFLEDMFAQHLAHKTVLACLAWVIFAVLLFGRWRFGWRGQRVVRWTLAGFATLLLGYFGSKLVLELILQR